DKFVCFIKPKPKIYSSTLSLPLPLLFGMFFAVLLIPLQAQAGFLSSILSNEAYAQTDKASLNLSGNPGNNLQTMDLLKANALPSTASLNKTKDSQIDESSNINIVSDNALLSAASPAGASLGGIGSGDVDFADISVYVVKSGDTLSAVAEMFGVTTDTILSVNDMKKGDKLKEGDILLILPFSGVEHTVAKGQTLQGIANLYKVNINEILMANDIEKDFKLAVGEKLMIPGAGMLAEPKPKSSGSIVRGGSSSLPSIAGYFKNPVPNGRKTRGLTNSHRGVDIAAPTGTPIYAAASGKVLTARTGWNGAYGNIVILQHSNGTRTLYAHMSRLGTSTNAQVSQGELIGYVGSSGRSTGPHLHFEVLGARNPF
ncbi:MAG: LysM peptidoglycan-binding domain-containing M23 family metallopeptidase, partial [Candidatus Paceibacterota bacterium]